MEELSHGTHNTMMYCKLGSETLQDIVARTIELLSFLKGYQVSFFMFFVVFIARTIELLSFLKGYQVNLFIFFFIAGTMELLSFLKGYQVILFFVVFIARTSY